MDNSTIEITSFLTFHINSSFVENWMGLDSADVDYIKMGNDEFAALCWESIVYRYLLDNIDDPPVNASRVELSGTGMEMKWYFSSHFHNTSKISQRINAWRDFVIIPQQNRPAFTVLLFNFQVSIPFLARHLIKLCISFPRMSRTVSFDLYIHLVERFSTS